MTRDGLVKAASALVEVESGTRVHLGRGWTSVSENVITVSVLALMFRCLLTRSF